MLKSSWDTHTGTFIVLIKPLHLYKAIIHPNLHYCSAVWDTPNVTLSRMPESVQTFALRLATKRWAASSEQLYKTEPLNPHSSCQKEATEAACADILRSESVIPPSMFTLVSHPNPHNQHSCPLVVPFARTNAFQSTFFIDCCSSWNDLPEHVITAPSPLSCKTLTSPNSYVLYLLFCFVYCYYTIVLSVATDYLLCYLPFLVLYTIIADSCIHYPFCHCCCPSLSLFLFFSLYFSLFVFVLTLLILFTMFLPGQASH